MSFDNRSAAREGNGGNSDVESQKPSLCKSGCGFYGNPAFDGLCSVCYKDKVKCTMQPVPTVASRSISSHGSPSFIDSACSVMENCDETHAISPVIKEISSSIEASNTVSDIETGSPTVSSAVAVDKTSSSCSDAQAADCVAASADVTLEVGTVPLDVSGAKDAESATQEKSKKNRCLTCKKRVGLTGFQCRCNGLFCSTHRYSDMHDCAFNYKELAQEQIRKNNPVVVGRKITKI